MQAIISPQCSVVDGLRIMQIANRVMVASRSEPGRWWDVTEGNCGCKGFEHRGRCAHTKVTAELFKPAAPDQPPARYELTGKGYLMLLPTAALPDPDDLPAQCPRCKSEPRTTRHPDGLGMGCISVELYGGDAA